MSAASPPTIALEAKVQSDTATDVLQEFARRWSRLMVGDADAVLSGRPLRGAEARLRDQLFFVLRSLTHAPDELLGGAFGVSLRTAMHGRRRYWERARSNPALEAYARLSLRTINRDAVFFERFSILVATEVEALRQRANRARSDALYRTSQQPGFQIGRCSALAAYFDNGGRQAFSDRARGNRWAAKADADKAR